MRITTAYGPRIKSYAALPPGPGDRVMVRDGHAETGEVSGVLIAPGRPGRAYVRYLDGPKAWTVLEVSNRRIRKAGARA